MIIPETPSTIENLDLMQHLKKYAEDKATYLENDQRLGPNAQKACGILYTSLLQLEQLFSPVLDLATTRELRPFTKHDHTHALKVGHLMWHILKPEKREHLTPPEIGMLIVSAYLHDLGMALTDEERQRRLDPDSDLWEKLEIREELKTAIEKLRERIKDPDLSESQTSLARQQLQQAEENLLSQDSRERHATKERYKEVLGWFADMHNQDPTRISDVKACMTYDGNSFLDKTIDICVSHNEDAVSLVRMDFGRPRFPTDYPVGNTTANLQLIAAALRLADILDFDRERTPPVLLYYLLPTTDVSKNRSALEWNKHLSISSWHVDESAIVYSGRCTSHIVHHAIVQFCGLITEEIRATHATFNPLGTGGWPFTIPLEAKPDIHEEGYKYIPYRFELDDQRIYELLMGGAIYQSPFVALRELIQNAVDACLLRDALTRLYDPAEPSKTDRIVITFQEPAEDGQLARITVQDSGNGMDAWILERYFLKVGQSYYQSAEFNRFRVDLRRKDLDFAPISEFGIGFLACFLLGDDIEVETAMWESPRQDTDRRILCINGPNRLIQLNQERNEGPSRFKGTRVTLFLRKDLGEPAKTWEKIKDYLSRVCLDLPYDLKLEYIDTQRGIRTLDYIKPTSLSIELPPDLVPLALRIPVNDDEYGLEGEIVLINPYEYRKLEQEVAAEQPVSITNALRIGLDTTSIRGGFNVGIVPGLPENSSIGAGARIRLTWQTRHNRRYTQPMLSRESLNEDPELRQRIIRIWLEYFLQHVDELPLGMVTDWDVMMRIRDCAWLEEYSAWQLYAVARQEWALYSNVGEGRLTEWENGNGDTLPFPTRYGKGSLCQTLLELVLPKITSLSMGLGSDLFVSLPKSEWQEVLRGWKSFLSEPQKWGPFITFIGGIDTLLYYASYSTASYLNEKYSDRLAHLSPQETSDLLPMFRHMVTARSSHRQAKLDREEAILLLKVIDGNEELMIGFSNDQWPLGSFATAVENE